MEWIEEKLESKGISLERTTNLEKKKPSPDSFFDRFKPIFGLESKRVGPSAVDAAEFGGPIAASLVDEYGDAAFPYSAICRLDLDFGNGQARIGTGCMVDSNLVLTAAHNVFDHQGLGAVESAQLTFGVLENSVGSHKTFNLVSSRISDKWRNSRTELERLNSDYALLLVKEVEGFGDAPHIKMHKNIPDTDWENGHLGVLNIVGHGRHGSNSQFQGLSYGPTKGAQGNFVKYDIHTEPGWSGGPVIFFDGTQHVVVAVHSSETNLFGSVAVRFTSEVHLDILLWKSELLSLS